MLDLFNDSMLNMKHLKTSIVVLISLVLLIGLFLWALTRLITPDQVRDYVNKQLTALTGQTSHADGDINWQLFPQPGLTIKSIRVGDEKDPKRYQLSINNLLFNLKIAPLLSGKLVFSEIEAHDFQMTINKNEPQAVDTLQKTFDQGQSASLHQRFAVERFLLTNGKVHWIDNNQVVEISKLQIATSELNFEDLPFPVQFKANFTFIDNQKLVSKGRLQFKGNTRLTMSFIKDPLANLSDLVVEGQLAVQDFRYNRLRINKITAQSYLKKHVLSLNPLTVNFYKGESIGDLVYYIDSHKLLLNQSGTAIDSSKLSDDLFGKKLITGLLDFSLHSESNLLEANWLLDSVANGLVTIKNGTLEAINLPKIIENVTANVNNQLASKNTDIQQLLKKGQFDNPDYFTGSTPFKLFTMQQHLQQRKVLADTLVLQTDKLFVKGQGQVNLNDYSLTGTLTAAVIDSSGKIALIQQLLGGSFPLLIQGSILNPLVVPNLKAINPLLTRYWLKSTLEKPIKFLQHFKAALTP